MFSSRLSQVNRGVDLNVNVRRPLRDGPQVPPCDRARRANLLSVSQGVAQAEIARPEPTHGPTYSRPEPTHGPTNSRPDQLTAEPTHGRTYSSRSGRIAAVRRTACSRRQAAILP